VARVGDKRGAYRVLVRKTEGKRRLERPGLRREDNITVDFNSVDWIGLAQVRGKWRAVVGTVLNLQVP
jgi:hypothetical protein